MSQGSRQRCDCGLVELTRSTWDEFGSVWGWPDWLLEHSRECCVRGTGRDGEPLAGPPMLYGPRSWERNRG